MILLFMLAVIAFIIWLRRANVASQLKIILFCVTLGIGLIVVWHYYFSRLIHL